MARHSVSLSRKQTILKATGVTSVSNVTSVTRVTRDKRNTRNTRVTRFTIYQLQCSKYLALRGKMTHCM
jgi:hypothetical protein